MKVQSLGLDHEAEFLYLGLGNKNHVLGLEFGLVVLGRIYMS